MNEKQPFNRKKNYNQNQRGSQSLSDLNHPSVLHNSQRGYHRGYRGRGRGQGQRHWRAQDDHVQMQKNPRSPNQSRVDLYASHSNFPPSYDESVQGQQFYARENLSHFPSKHAVCDRRPGGPPPIYTPRQMNFHPPPSGPAPTTAAIPKPMPRKTKKAETSDSCDPYQIVRELVSFIDLFTDVSTLSRILARDYSEVLKVIQKHNAIFQTLDDGNKLLVELCPSAKICENHLGPSGCSRKGCVNFHICLDYATGTCYQKNCAFGHSWKSNHNEYILGNLFLDKLPLNILSRILQKSFKGTIGPKICFQYQEQKCNFGDRCDKLHICLLYVKALGICSNLDQCKLNHNIRVPQCKALLEKLGISLNESPRDILKIIASSRQDQLKDINGPPIIDNPHNSQTGGNTSKSQTQDEGGKMDAGIAKSQINKVANVKDKQEKEKAEQNKKETVCAWDFHGNVETLSVCFAGLFGKCAYLQKGCKFLHAKKTYHWQFGGSKKWYNFHHSHVSILEDKYRDKNCDQVVLPKLISDQVLEGMKDLFSLLGHSEIKVDFQSMSLECQGSQKCYSVRHITTASTVFCNKPLNTAFNWYFKDDTGKWELFNNCDNSVSSLEKAFIEYCENTDPKNTIATFIFAANGFRYEINFTKMLQTNLSTRKVREIRRRPAPFCRKDKKSSVGVATNLELPKYWEKMKKEEVFKLVKLNPTSPEYKDVCQIILLTQPLCNIMSVFRIQNPHIWRKFKNKESELESKYKEKFLNIQKLFSGINSIYLDDICQENLDWRKHDPHQVAWYGQGTYFYNSISEASQKCSVDSNGHKKLLIADVIIGKLTQGAPGMTRPPENSVSDVLFDTTVDSVVMPKTFVKYNISEYYPSYVVQFA